VSVNVDTFGKNTRVDAHTQVYVFI